MNIWVWVAAFLTLAIYSFLYKDNPIYRITEYLFIGVSVGYGLGYLYHNSLIPRVIQPILQGNYIIIIPSIIGLLFFARFSRRWAWLVLYPISIEMGIGAGLGLPRMFQAYIFKQLQATMVTFSISNLIMVIGVICTLTYFFFSVEHKGAVGKLARIGIWYVMIAFGAIFGYTVMARVSLLIGRMQFLLSDWLNLIK